MGTNNGEAHAWVARPWAARLIRVVARLVPAGTSILTAVLLASRLPAARTVAGAVAGWLAVAAVSTAVLVATDRVTRRLLPLSTLFTLTLAFPDRVPSRFRIAIRIGTAAQLRRRLDEVRRGDVGETPGEVAERLLELVGLLSKHDRLTRGHSERVRAYSHVVGRQLGLSGVALDRLRWAALLHDIGKLMVSAEVLNKPGRLTDEEFAEIKTHPMAGRELVEPLAWWLGDSARAVWEHHERFDGGGYPQGLAGEEISLAARIVCVTDAYDVMTSSRSYKQPMAAADARRELARCAGEQFDPEVVRAFLSASLGRLDARSGPVAWFAQAAMFPRTIAAQLAGTMTTGAAIGVGVVGGLAGVVAASESMDLDIEAVAGLVASDDQSPPVGGGGQPGVDGAPGSRSIRPGAADGSGGTDVPGAAQPDDGGPVSDDGGVPSGGLDAGPPPTSAAGAGGAAGATDGDTTDPVASVAGNGPGSTSVTTTVTVPSSTIPGATVPASTTPPSVTVPGPTVPTSVTLPPATVLPTTLVPVTLPGVTLPPVTVPGVTVPPVTVPPTTLVPVTLPGGTLPPVTVPPTTLVPVTLPPTTLAPVTLPPTTLAPVTLPPTTLAPVTLPPTTLAPVTLPPTTLAPVTVPPTTLPPIGLG